jgi:hypothetical protein
MNLVKKLEKAKARYERMMKDIERLPAEQFIDIQDRLFAIMVLSQSKNGRLTLDLLAALTEFNRIKRLVADGMKVSALPVPEAAAEDLRSRAVDIDEVIVQFVERVETVCGQNVPNNLQNDMCLMLHKVAAIMPMEHRRSFISDCYVLLEKFNRDLIAGGALIRSPWKCFSVKLEQWLKQGGLKQEV